MENWIIPSKLIILFYCIFRYVTIEPNNVAAVVAFTLIYISITVIFYIIKNVKYRWFIIFISIVLCITYFQFVNVIFIFLVPVSIFELVFTISNNLGLSITLSITPVLLLKGSTLLDYILISSLCFIIYMLAYNFHSRSELLLKENDEMREKLHFLALKIDKNKDYENQIKYSSQLEERNKMAQYLHDRLGHTISGSLIQLEAAKLFVDLDSDKSKDILQKVIDILREGMDSIRLTLKNIKPAVEQLGINRIKLTLDEYTLNHNIKTALLHRGNLELIPHSHWKIIDESLTEALTNTLKYSNATLISISIEVLNKLVKAEIKDNGEGTKDIKKGLGLNGIEERSSTVNGKVIIDSTEGFSIILLLPIEEAM
jgi:signal transduction histidine kinase